MAETPILHEVLKATDSALAMQKPPEAPALETLTAAIERGRAKEDGRQILNRAQQMLELEEHDHVADSVEAKDLDDRIARSEAAMKAMADMLATMKRNREDLRIVIDARLESIHTKRKRGITLP